MTTSRRGVLALAIAPAFSLAFALAFALAFTLAAPAAAQHWEPQNPWWTGRGPAPDPCAQKPYARGGRCSRGVWIVEIQGGSLRHMPGGKTWFVPGPIDPEANIDGAA